MDLVLRVPIASLLTLASMAGKLRHITRVEHRINFLVCISVQMVEVSSTVILQVLYLFRRPQLDPLLLALSSQGQQHRPLPEALRQPQPPLRMVMLLLELMANVVVKAGPVSPRALQDTLVWFRTHVGVLSVP